MSDVPEHLAVLLTPYDSLTMGHEAGAWNYTIVRTIYGKTIRMRYYASGKLLDCDVPDEGRVTAEIALVRSILVTLETRAPVR